MTYSYVTWRIHVWQDVFIRDVSHSYLTRRVYLCDMTHAYVPCFIHDVPCSHVVFMCDMTYSYMTWLIQLFDMTHAYVPCFIHDMPHSHVTSRIHVRHDVFIRDVTHSFVWHDTCICALFHTWHAFLKGYCSTVQGLLDWFEVDLGFPELVFIQIDLCNMTHAYLPCFIHDMPYPYVTWRIHVWHDVCMCDMTYSCVTWRIHTRRDSFIFDKTCSFVWHDTCICGMTHSHVPLLSYTVYAPLPPSCVYIHSPSCLYIWGGYD